MNGAAQINRELTSSIWVGSSAPFTSGGRAAGVRSHVTRRASAASTLLYSLLHLSGVKAVNPKYEVLGKLSVSLDDLKNFRLNNQLSQNRKDNTP